VNDNEFDEKIKINVDINVDMKWNVIGEDILE
jgi:hypothetical protein